VGTEPSAFAPSPWTIYCDGSAMPNPGFMGIGAVIIEPSGQRHLLSRATHAKGCNNEAELRALIAALERLESLGTASSRLQVYSDSSILVEQLGGAQAKPIVRLEAMFAQARALLSSFDQVRFQWIPRHRNGEADALARAALGAGPKAAA
jgi:ribonuclease HI